MNTGESIQLQAAFDGDASDRASLLRRRRARRLTPGGVTRHPRRTNTDLLSISRARPSGASLAPNAGLEWGCTLDNPWQ